MPFWNSSLCSFDREFSPSVCKWNKNKVLEQSDLGTAKYGSYFAFFRTFSFGSFQDASTGSGKIFSLFSKAYKIALR